MRYETDIRETLIDNAIHLISEGGFERATTKNLTYRRSYASEFKMNEAYIYRIFGSKENLYDAAFARLDAELFDALKKGIQEVGALEKQTKERLYALFLRVWKFLLGNEDRCRCYIRYYYSVYFKGNSRASHNKMFNELVKGTSSLFKDEADVNAILHSVFTTLFDFAIRVYNGDLEDSEINRPHIFNVLYNMMVTYFENEFIEVRQTEEIRVS